MLDVLGWPLDRGDLVSDIGDLKTIGEIIIVGVEISEVRWETGAKQFVSNDYLVRRG